MRLVRGAALEHEAAVAIAAFDEARFIVDHIIDAPMAKSWIDLAGAVAIDPGGLGSKNFGRRLHGVSP